VQISSTPPTMSLLQALQLLAGSVVSGLALHDFDKDVYVTFTCIVASRANFLTAKVPVLRWLS
jgi:hypothetical protein